MWVYYKDWQNLQEMGENKEDRFLYVVCFRIVDKDQGIGIGGQEDNGNYVFDFLVVTVSGFLR